MSSELSGQRYVPVLGEHEALVVGRGARPPSGKTRYQGWSYLEFLDEHRVTLGGSCTIQTVPYERKGSALRIFRSESQVLHAVLEPGAIVLGHQQTDLQGKSYTSDSLQGLRYVVES